MVPSGTVFPNTEEGSHSDFFCLPSLISERRQLGVHMERENEKWGDWGLWAWRSGLLDGVVLTIWLLSWHSCLESVTDLFSQFGCNPVHSLASSVWLWHLLAPKPGGEASARNHQCRVSAWVGVHWLRLPEDRAGGCPSAPSSSTSGCKSGSQGPRAPERGVQEERRGAA